MGWEFFHRQGRQRQAAPSSPAGSQAEFFNIMVLGLGDRVVDCLGLPPSVSYVYNMKNWTPFLDSPRLFLARTNSVSSETVFGGCLQNKGRLAVDNPLFLFGISRPI